MTAEIAILNRNAVAMAADSAVTLQLPGGQKIYNTVNKLFTLSKYRPVGIMVYGSGDFMSIPWETIIKMYRASLRDKGYGHLHEYATDFLEFFEKEASMFPAELQQQSASSHLRRGFFELKQRIDSEVESTIKAAGSIDENQARKLAGESIDSFIEELQKLDNLTGFGDEEAARCAGQCEKEIDQAARDVLEELVSDDVTHKLRRAGGLILSKKLGWGLNYSGVVICGYGEKELFPSLVAYECECLINNKLRYRQTQDTTIGITPQSPIASVSPFAQREMVNRFMEGVDPQCESNVEDYISTLLGEGYPAKIAEGLSGKVSDELRDSVQRELVELGKRLAEDFANRFSNHRQSQFIGPVIDSVAAMPKNELAAMAESLVNLTAFKRRMTSVETDTVALPIDVAVISKGDGFIWIKRKHYFEPELNHQFFSNYYRKDEAK
jgi:hypothetical protein